MHDDLRKFDLNLLVALDALLEEKHVSRAATRLGLSQPAMSRMLARTRDAFDDPLLVRGGGGLILTERAMELRPKLLNALDQVEQLFDADEFDPATASRVFRLKATHYVIQNFLPDIVRRYFAVASHAGLVIDDLKAHDLESDHNASADLSIVANGIDVPQTFMRKKLGNDKFVCVMSREHPLAKKGLTLDTYLNYRHVIVLLGSGLHTPIDALLQGMGRTREKALHVVNSLAAMDMLRGSELLMTVSSRQVDRYADDLGLVWHELPFEVPEVEYSLVWHPVHQQNAAHGWFRKFIYKEMRQAFASSE